jgi:hypothetical protein
MFSAVKGKVRCTRFALQLSLSLIIDNLVMLVTVANIPGFVQSWTHPLDYKTFCATVVMVELHFILNKVTFASR